MPSAYGGVWQHLATKKGIGSSIRLALRKNSEESISTIRMVATAAEVSRLGYQHPFLMGLGFDRMWLVTLTVFRPDLPFRSGRQITFAILASPPFRGRLPLPTGSRLTETRVATVAASTDGAVRDRRQLNAKNGRPRLNNERSITV
jgi:hypothetical protein